MQATQDSDPRDVIRRRRRGDALETAILEAAFQELLDRGYNSFTVDGVAKRVGTSRPVLNRRWKQRADLAVAAIKRQIEQTQIDVPDMGSVRDELLSMLRQLTTRRLSAVQNFTRQMADYFQQENSSPARLREEVLTVDHSVIDEILQRGVSRQEIDEARLTPRVRRLLTDLARHEALLTWSQVTEQALVEMVDDIFLPLVRRAEK